ncbi:MAG: penicillin-binding protein activator [Kiloniellaceae bacterium]
MSSPTSLPRRCLAACLGLGALLVVSACQAPTVPKRLPPAQAAPQTVLPGLAAPAPSGPPPSEESADTAVTQIDLDEPVKVALLLPLSGRHAALGEALLNAAALALFDIAGARFALIVRDTGATPEGAREAAQSALAAGARLVLGPVFATSVETMASEARGVGVNVIAFSNDRTVAGEGVFIMGLAPQPQIDRLVGYASGQGLTRFAVLAPQSPYGRAVIEALQDAVLRYGVELTRVVTYPPGAADVSQEVRALADYDVRRQALLAQRQVLAARADEAAKLALKRLDGLETLGAPDFDAVVVPAGGKRLQTVAPLLAYFDVDPAEVRYLGTAEWADPRLGAEPTLAGGWFTAPPPELWETFRKRYRTSFGKEPPRIAALAYDATALAAVLARRAVDANEKVDFSRAALTQPSGFSGVDGVFRFLPDGDIERRLAVLELRRGGFKVLDEAPRTFQEVAY